MRLHLLPVRKRAGFTLIEILVVIGILATLAAIAMGTYFRVMNSQELKRSETTVKKMYNGLHAQWNAVIDDVKDEIKNGKTSQSNNSQLWTLSGNNQDRANALYMKMRLQQEFPMTFKEAINSPFSLYNVKAKTAYVQAFNNLSCSSTQDESSACLYLALAQNRRGANFNADDLGPGTVKPLTTIAGGSTINGFFDSWGNTIWWARWTADDTLAAEMGMVMGNRDAEDPAGLLAQPTWAQQGTAATLLSHPFSPYPPYPFANTNTQRNRGPYLHCAGPNKKTGTINGVDYTKDDIYSWRLLKEGQRGN